MACSGIINVVSSCTPNWQCELPLNGYEDDGCGNRRLNSSCNNISEDIIDEEKNINMILIYGLIGGVGIGLLLLLRNR